MGGNFSPSSLSDSSFQVKAVFDARQFNDKVIGPVNSLIRGFADGLKYLLRKTPVYGDRLAGYVDTFLDWVLIQLRYVSVEAFLGPTRASFAFQVDLYALGSERTFRIGFTINPTEIIKKLWNSTFKPFLDRLFS